MRRIPLAVLALALACEQPTGAPDEAAAAALGVADEATVCVLNTRLSPEEEVRVPPVTDPVDSTASGHAQVKVRLDGTLEWKVFVLNRDAETFVAGHIHAGEAGANGGVVQTLFAGETSEAQLLVHDAAASPELAEALCTDPAAYYVNFHTTEDPQGAIRGQLD